MKKYLIIKFSVGTVYASITDGPIIDDEEPPIEDPPIEPEPEPIEDPPTNQICRWRGDNVPANCSKRGNNT